jgi:hypothetical protein
MVYDGLVSGKTGLLYRVLVPGGPGMVMEMNSNAKRMKERISAIVEAY